MTINYKNVQIYDLSFGWKIKGIEIYFPTLYEAIEYVDEVFSIVPPPTVCNY